MEWTDIEVINLTVKTTSLDLWIVTVIRNFTKRCKKKYDFNFHTFFTETRMKIHIDEILSKVRVKKLEISGEISSLSQNS